MDVKSETALSYGSCSEENKIDIGTADPRHTENASDSRTNADSDKVKKKQALASVLILSCVVVGQINLSMVAPTFPQLALAKGIGPGRQGFIFNMPDVVALILMLTWGKLLPHVGSKFLMVTSALSLGVTSSLFGLLEYSPGGTTFYALALIIRIFEG